MATRSVELESSVRAMEKLAQEASRIARQDLAGGANPQALSQRNGPQPSVQDYIEGLAELHAMHRDELVVKVAAVKSLSYSSPAQDLQAARAILGRQPCIDPERVQYLLARVLDCGPDPIPP